MAEKKIMMGLHDVNRAMRKVGIHTSPVVIADGIASGVYPFGRVVSTGPTGRRHFEIFAVDFYAWLKTRIPEEGEWPCT